MRQTASASPDGARCGASVTPHPDIRGAVVRVMSVVALVAAPLTYTAEPAAALPGPPLPSCIAYHGPGRPPLGNPGPFKPRVKCMPPRLASTGGTSSSPAPGPLPGAGLRR